jgi:hypothetical protein
MTHKLYVHSLKVSPLSPSATQRKIPGEPVKVTLYFAYKLHLRVPNNSHKNQAFFLCTTQTVLPNGNPPMLYIRYELNLLTRCRLILALDGLSMTSC